MIELDRCPICGGHTSLWRYVNGYGIERCRRCGYAFVSPRPDRREISEIYRSGAGASCEVPESAADVLARERAFPNTTVDALRIISRIVEMIGPGGRLLDVGCGSGLFSREAQSRGLRVDAIEIGPIQRSVATEFLGAPPMNVDFEDFAEDGHYEAILMSQILEHVVDVNEWIVKARGLLVPGGIIAVAAPNFGNFIRLLAGPRDPYVETPMHLNYFSPRNLASLLMKHGLKVERSETVSRIPFNVLSKRLGRVPEAVRAALDRSVALAQRPPLALADRAGVGIFLNVYARA